MMLAHPEISSLFDFEIPYVNTLVIENRQFYRTLLVDLVTQLGGDPGRLVLSEKNTPIPIAKNAELLTEFVPFQMNRKTLLSRLTAALERASMEDEHYLRTQELLQMTEQYILELSEDLACDVCCTKLNMGAILKAAGLEAFSLNERPLEALVDYMSLMRDLDGDKLFVLINFRSFFDDLETGCFINTVIDHGLRVLMIEGTAYLPVKGEKRVTIDRDLCEF